MIRGQGDRQLDLISAIDTAGRTKGIGFQNERLKNLKNEIDDKEDEIRRNKEVKKKEEKDKAIFNYTATDNTPFYFSDYTDLMKFAQEIYPKKLSSDEAKKEQGEILKKINDLKKRINPSQGSRKPQQISKEKMENVVKNAEDIYNFRNKIINEINKATRDQNEDDEQTEDKPLPSWTNASIKDFNSIREIINKASKEKLYSNLGDSNLYVTNAKILINNIDTVDSNQKMDKNTKKLYDKFYKDRVKLDSVVRTKGYTESRKELEKIFKSVDDIFY